MKSNPLVKFLVIPFAILALFVVVKLFSKGSSEKQAQAPETLVLSTGEAKKLGVDGDTPGDTLRTIVVESRQLKDQVSNALKNNDELKQQNLELQRRLQSINDNVDSKLQNVQQTMKQESQQQSQTILDTLQQQYNTLSSKSASSNPSGSDSAYSQVMGKTSKERLDRMLYGSSRRTRPLSISMGSPLRPVPIKPPRDSTSQLPSASQ